MSYLGFPWKAEGIINFISGWPFSKYRQDHILLLSRWFIYPLIQFITIWVRHPETMRWEYFLGIVHRSILGDKILQQINVAHPSLHWIVCNSYLINKIKIMNTQIQLGKTLMVNLGTGSHFQKLRTRIWF